MTDTSPVDARNQRQPVLSRPPVEGTDEEIDAWADAFVEAVLGPVDDQPRNSSSRRTP